ncbi:MAG: four helix bundle suffix domain-containing protein [Bacteroidaceae bacterium]|nr:four helix bundle suffix domain-containing protein [Bacteroidaceae bacterium]
MPDTFLPQHGSYRNLRVYHVAEAIYGLTYHFAHTFLPKGDRTVDQMVQAARSGKQNIAEGNQAAATSAETELKLTNVAKASLEELRLDYEDYLRVRRLTQWGDGHPRYASMRNYARSSEFEASYAELAPRLSDEELANLCLTLIHQAIYMLHGLLLRQQQRFVQEGGIRERMTRVRLAARANQNNPSNQSTPNTPNTPNTPKSNFPK